MTPEILNWFHEYVPGVIVEYLNKPKDKQSVSGSPQDWTDPPGTNPADPETGMY